MNLRFRLIVLAAMAACTVRASLSSDMANSPRQELAADAGWKFFLGDPSGAEAPAFTDAAWRAVDLPHDWSI